MNRTPKILVVGSFVMDLIATTDRAPKSGQTIVGRDFHIAPGGKGANQAVQCARLGADVTMIGCVGGDIFARELLDTARDAGVHVEHVKIDPSVSSGIGHVLLEVTEHSAQNRITVIPGANQHLYPEDIAWLQPRIQEYDMVLLQMEIPLEINLLVSQWAADAGIPVMLNPAPAAALSDQLLSHVTYLTPNEQEAAVETGLPLHTTDGSISETDLQAIAAALREKGVEHVIITLGGNGSCAYTRNIAAKAPVYDVKSVEKTGAGDTFFGCVLNYVLEHETDKLTKEQLLELLYFANAGASLITTRKGALKVMPNRQEIQDLMRSESLSER